jgi:hypothetical protein
MSNLTITRSKGFHLTFENGYTISVQFGQGNYCDNKYVGMNPWVDNPFRDKDCNSRDAEIAVWNPENDMEQLLVQDQVVGWLKADDVARAISYVQKGQIKALKRMCRSRM